MAKGTANTSGAAARALAFASALAATAAFAAPPPLRIAYNYCTLSYTFAYCSDAEWDAEIDRLARAGYNAALVIDGTFKVWQATLRDLGWPEDEIAAFIPDECARAWWLMGNLTGEGGPLDQATIDADGERGRRICAKMRERGIEPILQGYVGMMPLSARSAAYGALPQGKWSCYERPPILDPTGGHFGEIADVWHRNLERIYGIKPKFLAGDLFHEGGKTHGIDVTAATRAVQAAQQRAFPGVTWVVQAWQANPTKAVRDGLDPRHTLVEALVKDMGSFAGDGSGCAIEFGDLPWVWCEVLNFGGNHGLYGNLRTFARLGRAAKGPGARTFRGYGSLSEGFFTNPVCYALFEEMMMRDAGSEMTDAELDAWLEDWIAKRYGCRDPRLSGAWRILAETVYACPRCQEGTVENVLCAMPSWEANNASSWGPTGGLWYAESELERAADLMAGAYGDVCAPGAAAADGNLAFDLYDLRRQVTANRLRALVPHLRGEIAARSEFMRLATSLAAGAPCGSSAVPAAFRLSTFEDQARARAGERGAKAFRRMVTTWADPRFGHSALADYANREYTELIYDYYIPRWMEFLAPGRHL